MFLSTRGYHYTYNYLVKSSKKNCESLLKKKTHLKLFKLQILPSIKFLLFLTYVIFSGKFFMKNRGEIKFEKIEIGRFILATTYSEYECYTNKFKFYLIFIKRFLLAGRILKTCSYYYTNYNIKGVYVDHCMYLNGIIFSFFAHKKLPVYSNNYPIGLFFVDFKKVKNKYLSKIEDALRLRVKKKINIFQKKKAEKKISSLTKKKDFIPYLAKVAYTELDNLDYKSFDYVIYTHSFTDAQLIFGYAGFENNLEWLDFTLNHLIKKNKKVLIKAHPNFYNHTTNQKCIWDKKIYEIFFQKYKKYDNLTFLNKPIHNYLLLKRISKKCILISMHGTSMLEAAYMNFKSICSKKNLFDEKFNISNMWNDKNEYLKLLNTNYSKLKKPNNTHFLQLIYAMFFLSSTEYSVNFYENIIRRNLKLTKIKYRELLRMNKIGKKTVHKENKIISEISNTIHRAGY